MGETEQIPIEELKVPGSQVDIQITVVPPETAGSGDDVNIEEDDTKDESTTDLITSDT